MALPPTRLTILLSRAGLEPVRLLDALDAAGLLSGRATSSTTALSERIHHVITDSERATHPGPTTHDRIARALIENDMLNARGLEWAYAPPFRRTFLVWILVGFLGWMTLTVFAGISLIGDAEYAFWSGPLLVVFGVVSGLAARSVWQGSRSAPRKLRWMGFAALGLFFAVATYDKQVPDLTTIATLVVSACLWWLLLAWLSRKLSTMLGTTDG